MKDVTKMLCALALVGLAACGDNLTPEPEVPAYVPGTPQTLECTPNLNGKIENGELAAAIGVPVNYRINPAGTEVEVNTTGSRDQDNVRVWDWSATSSDDQLLTAEAEGLGDKWYAASFPEGQFVSDLDAAGLEEGVYAITDAGLLLYGFASAEEAPTQGKTLFVYNDPVIVYPFPIEPGASWVSTGVVENATFRGLPYAGRDIYAGEVTEMGEMWLPEVRFEQAHKVVTSVTVQPAVGQSVSRKQISYLFECFGEVARAVSRNGESEDNFTVATEIRRLGF